MVYRDYDTFRNVYSGHAKDRWKKVVILLPYSEKTDRVRCVLDRAGIDVQAQESSGFLVTMDSCSAYLGFQQDGELFNRLVSHAIVSRKAESA